MTDFMTSLYQRFTSYNPNPDGDPDIVSISDLAFESSFDGPRPGQATPLVLVIVEPRLLRTRFAEPAEPLMTKLMRWKTDLTRQGFSSRFMVMDVYGGNRHQDGRTVLSIREFLRAVRHAVDGHLAGAVFVGAFPEPTIAARYLWRVDTGSDGFDDPTFANRQTLRWRAEVVADRTDLVLGDLSGRWEDLYRESVATTGLTFAPRNPPANWPANGATYEGLLVEYPTTFDDVFFIDPDSVDVVTTAAGTAVRARFGVRPPELAEEDLDHPNHVAVPEICISRVNARNVALVPDPALHGIHGETFIDRDGRPQSVTVGAGQALPPLTQPDAWIRDLRFERQLLCEYLDRNHEYRSGLARRDAMRWASMASPVRDFAASGVDRCLQALSPHLAAGSIAQDPNLAGYVRWLKQPALVRGLQLHSDPWGSQTDGQSDAVALEREVGGPSYWWERHGDRYEPAYYTNGRIDLPLHHTLWRNRTLPADAPSFFIHAGCMLNSPAGGDVQPYNGASYGFNQAAEGILFYLQGLGVIARAKVYNDFPVDLAAAWTEAATMGEAMSDWLRAHRATAVTIANAPDRTKAYTWSVLGDWTLPAIPTVAGRAGDGTEIKRLIGGGANLHGVRAGDGSLMSLLPGGSAFATTGTPGAEFRAHGRCVIALTPTRDATFLRYADADWVQIGGRAQSVGVANVGIWAERDDGIHLYDTGLAQWTRIGGLGAVFVGCAADLFAITPDGAAVMRWTGVDEEWTVAGGPAADLIGGGSRLRAIDPGTKEIYERDPVDGEWTRIGGPGAAFVAHGNLLIGLSSVGGEAYRYAGEPDRWDPLPGRWDEIALAGGHIYGLERGMPKVACIA